jgi:diguanylate cyclase (GGDEF)-like protein/PAS domain S-box-containing protein
MRTTLNKLTGSPNYTLGILAGFFILLIGTLFFADLRSRHQAAIDGAKQSALNFAEILAEHTARTFDGVDRALREVEIVRRQKESGRYASDQMVGDALRHLQQASPLLVAVGWTNAAGEMQANSYDFDQPRANIAEAPHFVAQLNKRDGKLFVSAPFHSLLADKWLLAASRRLNNADGTFAGIVNARIDQSYFSSIFRSIHLGKNGSVMLLHRDGQILVREPFIRGAVGKSVVDRSLLGLLPVADAGSYEARSPYDGVDRIGAYKAVPDLPVVVAVTYDRAEVLVPWRKHLYTFGSMTALVIAIILFGTRHLMRQTRKLAEETDLLELSLGNTPQGLCMFDKSARISVCNQNYLQMYNLSPEVVRPGCTLRQLIHHRKEVGLLTQDPEQYYREILAAVAEGKTTSSRVETRDGRVIHVINRPIQGGGWVTTHEDISEQRKAVRELEETRNFFKTVIDHVPAAIFVKRAQDFSYVLINGAAEKFFGLQADQVIGKSAHDFFRKEDADVLLARDKELLKTGHQRFDDDRPIHVNSGAMRHITTERLIVRGADGQPKYLLAVVVDITEQKRTEAQIAFMAHHDLLTGLANRALFMKKIEEAGARLRRSGEAFTVLILDLDRFKNVNDSLGHPAGDALLKKIAQRLRPLLRETDVLSRIGGDEFAIIQVGEASPRERAIALASKIVDVITQPHEISGNRVSIGTSIGIAMAPKDGSDPDELIKKADLALYRAKSQGRNGYCFFDLQITKDADARRQMENDLRRALARNELELHYQPIIDVKTRKPCGAEALVRWRHPERGYIFPDQFIPLAEETGLIIPLGQWVLQRACADAAAWPADIKLAVNLSPVQFVKGNLFDVILGALAASGLPPQRLELEITESVLLEGDADVPAVIGQLKNIGVSIALDDFGTGYSSLKYLTVFQFDKIKIDKSFTQNITERPECAAIVSSVLTLAYGLNIATTAEGVETEEQFRLLRIAGVHSVQGYLFGRPCPLSELDLLRVYLDRPAEDAA